jgi:quinol monooxygenase YgiN
VENVYDGASEMQRAAGVTDASVYRDEDDPNVVLVVHRFGSRADGEAFMDNPDAKSAMEAAGS